ncbi:class I SAM-dependent methyltransferase [Rhodococcus sp. B50]|uniref:class I SAM-dependent methyltransferase n=1 Tax=Rhodococcus sp. B50 TaxID=2682847 RepID=UPI001BD45320|nr:class I SAM-dependent methyltransferase [Rhodococcus sp. B50]MBS9374444.1 Demethylmenaquinone methyltransferase [Rhodococcus sp. B50]
MTTSDESPESFRIPIETAEFYESAFVPAFFAQWAPILCDAAGVAPGRRVLDVGCGTGIVTRTAADLVAPDGIVLGVDLNEAMLTVARRVRPDIEFRQGDAGTLPFPDESFDTVLCQMALMFFPDRFRALREMARVVAVGGTVAVVVPGALDSQPAFAPFVRMAARHAGAEATSLLSTYFVCGDIEELTDLVESAGLRVTTARTHPGTYRASSVDAFVTTEVESTPLLERISDDVYGRIRAGAHDVLAPFTTSDGSVEAPFECTIVVARRQ